MLIPDATPDFPPANARVPSYAYDYRGRRISRTIYGAPNVTIRYAYDGDQIIAEYDGSGTLLRKFVYGPGVDEPICLIDVANGNAAYYYHLDGLGSVVALSNVNKVLVERYAYDVFGRPTIRDPNGVVLAASARGNPYLFTARAYDAESGLYYYRARYYDYATGRFLQADPIGSGDGLNLYAYVGNGPVGHTDPLGLMADVAYDPVTNTVNIQVPITLVGPPGASPQEIAAVRHRIQNETTHFWNRQSLYGYGSDAYKVNVTITSPAPGEPTNTITLTNQPIRSSVDFIGGTTGEWYMKPQTNGMFAHEVGHLTGCLDHYTDKYIYVPGLFALTSIPVYVGSFTEPGFENNIMGRLGMDVIGPLNGTSVGADRRNIDEILDFANRARQQQGGRVHSPLGGKGKKGADD